ncbi:MAG: hypothetical protein JNK69_02095 [Saprospiraceae bacterium]|nr:hypothetical protein [Candidatus Vicinibacter proximus]MBL7822175.1 hypothetical protein [Saprospiraceae bacterium]MCC6843305.1 hypothetical protein [Saprospiraceae bacterium]
MKRELIKLPTFNNGFMKMVEVVFLTLVLCFKVIVKKSYSAYFLGGQHKPKAPASLSRNPLEDSVNSLPFS